MIEKMVKIQRERRNFGLDALKVLAMLIIVVHHVIGHGGILWNMAPFSDKYAIIWLIYTVSVCAVNCYALITGYVGITAKESSDRLMTYWLQVVFYALGIGLICWKLFPDMITLEQCLKGLMPVTSVTYWYFTAYFGVVILSPILNCALCNLPEQVLRRVILCGFMLFSVIPTLRDVDPYNLVHGMSVIWLGWLYMLGGYIRIYARKAGWYWRFRRISLVLFFLSVLAAWGYMILTERGFLKLPHGGRSDILIWNTSVAIVTASSALFVYFEGMKVKPQIERQVARLSALTFGIYLIHDHPLLRKCLIHDRFIWLIDAFDYKTLPLVLLGISLVIFVVCACIECVRSRLFVALRIRERCVVLVDKLSFNKTRV